jgi:ADP-heptose:LPS heptosyltransferase
MPIPFVSDVRRIAILRALKLGDLLCTVPAFRALRAAHPFAEIRLIGLPWASELVRRYDGYLDGLFELPGFPGMPERPFDARAFTRFLDEVQSWAPDLVLQMHGSGDLSNPLAMLLGGRTTGGYYLPGQFCPDPERFIPYPDDLPEVGRHLRLLAHLGIESRGMHKELPVYDADRRVLRDVLASTAIECPYVVVHPGASVPERRWPPERFAAVADELAARGLRIVLTGSAGEEDTTSSVRRAMRALGVDLTGRTDLGTLAALLADAKLLVSNDTGVMHVAEAVGTPLVAVSFDPESWRWEPRDAERCPVLRGGTRVTVGEVLDAARAPLCRRTGVPDDARVSAGQTPDGWVGPPGRG